MDEPKLKKGFFGWRIIHPVKNDDGSWNIPNLLFGGWGNLIKLIVLISITLIIYFGLTDLTTQCEYAINNACEICTESLIR